MLSACHSSRKATTVSAYKYTPTQSNRKATHDSPSAGKLIHEAESWLGTPYKYGGNDRKGVDCSGLVLQVYKNALGIALPRTSREQRDYCAGVASASLYPGDLVFFSSDSNRDRVSHVGIFMGDNLMIHASTSKGVIVSDISTSYYRRNYLGGGQVAQYHALIGKPLKKNKKTTPVPATPAPEVPEVHISQLESPAGFNLTPAKELPKRDTTTMTAEEARAAVLGSLPEQNITQQ